MRLSTNSIARRSATLGKLACALAVIGVTVTSAAMPAEAAVVRPFTLNVDTSVYGDFILAGNGSLRCPTVGDPVDPFGTPIADCATAQARTNTSATGINDSFYMRWADVDSSAATYNSSTAAITVPPGATVRNARLTWSGDTGTIRLADGTVSALPGCNTRQFLAGGGTAGLPAGTPESTSVRLSVGAGAAVAIAPQAISRDALANVPASQPQFYAAYADVTSSFAGVTTGAPVTITVGNVWSPTGFGCYSGWSLVLVYGYDAPNATYAPVKRDVFVYDGHVRQSSVDPTTTVTISGFRTLTSNVRAGLTAFEGDFNIPGDQLSVNGVAQAEGATATTTNYFVSRADQSSNPSVSNNMSVDAKAFTTAQILAGATSATASLSTSGDTYLAANLVLSTPVPSLYSTTVVPAGPYRPGEPVTYTVTVVSPGGPATNVVIDSNVPECDRPAFTLASDVPFEYTCTGAAPADDFTATTAVTGVDPFGDVITHASSADVVIINPAIDITKTTDETSYAAGDLVTFTITVANVGDTALTSVEVDDPTVAACDSPASTLGVGGVFSYTCTAIAPVVGNSNTATVTALDPLGGTVTDSATVPVVTLASVSGSVVSDRNGNGSFDAGDGDTGIGGVTMTLTRTSAGAPFSTSVVTAPDGSFSITGVPDGTYTLTETQPGAFDDGIDTVGNNATVIGNDTFQVTINGGIDSTGNRFAELPTSSLSGSAYVDVDNDGVRDAGEVGLLGVTIVLTGTDDAGNPVNLTTTTVAGGSYTFDALRAGLYTITETQPASYGDGIDTPGVAGGVAVVPDTIAAIPLLSRTDATGYLFGELPGSLSGRVYVDLDGSGTDTPGEPGIAGVTVTLSGTQSGTAVTDSNGEYSFLGLAAGTYSITETQPIAYADGTDTVGTAGGTMSAPDTINAIVLGPGAGASTYDFGEIAGVFGGNVYHDLDRDGTRDGSETGIPGVSVRLSGLDVNGNVVDLTVVTDGDGDYLFIGVPAGQYTVTETQPAGYGDGLDTVGTGAGGSPTGLDSFTGLTLVAGGVASGYDFAERTGSIAGAVFHDLDADGVRDPGEPALGGVTVTLSNAGGVVATVNTDAITGAFEFTGLLEDEYTITETQPAGYGDGVALVGTAGGIATPNQVTAIALDAGELATGYLFSELTGALTGVVYVDDDGDGTQDAGEVGIAGVTITLTGTDVNTNPVNLTTTTGADGSYAFVDLLAGTYTITQTQPVAYGDGLDTVGTLGGSASNDVM